jgi:hypothetical protein
MRKYIVSAILVVSFVSSCGTMMTQDQFIKENIDYYYMSDDYSFMAYSIKDLYTDRDLNSKKYSLRDSLLTNMIILAHKVSMQYDLKATYSTTNRHDPRQHQYSLIGEGVSDQIVEQLADLVETLANRMETSKQNNRPTIFRYASSFRTIYQFDVSNVDIAFGNEITKIRIHRAIREHGSYAFPTALTEVDFDKYGNIINYRNRAFNLVGFLGVRDAIQYNFTKR